MLRKQRLLIFFVPMFIALPFLNRAYFVDDHFFFEIARWIKDNPLKPYDFPADGALPGDQMSGKDITARIVNPLLHQFYMAALMKVGGEREWFLRAGGVLISCFSALLLFELARRWLTHAFLATLLLLVTPAQWLTSYSLLIDPTMAFLFIAGLYAWLRSADHDSVAWAIASGVAIGLALVTKYTAMLAIPVLATWTYLNRASVKRPRLLSLPIVISFAFLAAYMGVTKLLYGEGHLFTASRGTLVNAGFGKFLVLMEFLSGATIAPLLVWPALSRRQAAGGVVLFVVLASFLASALGGFEWTQSIVMSLWLSTSLMMVVASFSSDRFLFLWLLGFLFMMFFVMPWVAARYYLIGLPPLVFCAARLIETRRPDWAKNILIAGIGLTAAVGLSLAYADYRQAESSRAVVVELRRKNLLAGDQNHYFSPAFTMTYLANEGWKPVSDLSALAPGDRVVTSEVSFPLFWRYRGDQPIKLVATIDCPASFPVRVMDARGGAGFYGSAWGPFPFSFSNGPWERFHLFEIMPRS